MKHQIIPQTDGAPHDLINTSRVADTISQFSAPISEATEKHTRELIRTAARLVSEWNMQRWFAAMERAKATAQYLRNRVMDVQSALANARRDLEGTKPVNCLKLLVCMICWFVCIAGELTLSWTTLPYALDVHADTVLGVAIAAIPVAALTVVEWIFARGVEEPYHQALNAASTGSSWRRVVAVMAMAVFLTLVLVGNIQTIRFLAQAREEASKVRRLDDSTVQQGRELDSAAPQEKNTVNYKAIDQMIMAVGVMAVVDGALLFLIGMQDWHNLTRRLQAQARVSWHAGRCAKAERLLSESLPIEQQWTRVWEERERYSEAIAEDFSWFHLAKLQEKIDNKPALPAPSIEELVEDALVRSFADAKNA